MTDKIPTSNDLIDSLVRSYFGVEPDALAALAHGDEETRLRRLPDDPPTTDPLDGLEVLVRRTIAICVALRGHPGAVSLVNERQAVAAGWPNAGLANRCIVLAWSLSMTEPTLALPLLIDADETTGVAMARLIRVPDRLPALDTLRGAFYETNLIDLDAMERVAAAHERAPALAGVRSRRQRSSSKNGSGSTPKGSSCRPTAAGRAWKARMRARWRASCGSSRRASVSDR